MWTAHRTQRKNLIAPEALGAIFKPQAYSQVL